MINENSKIHKIAKLNVIVKGILIYLVLAFLYIVFACTGFYLQAIPIKIITAVILIAIIAYILIINKKSEVCDYEFLISMVILMGIVMRFYITLYSNCKFFTYDMGDTVFNVEKSILEFHFFSNGHAGYILSIVKGHLPESNDYQFYQQPFFYILGGITSFATNLIIKLFDNDRYLLIDAAKLISCEAGCLVLYITKSLCKEFNLKDKSSLICVSFVSFYPGLMFLSSRLTPDSLTMFFVTLTFLYTYKWHKDNSWKNTIILALSYGLGVMTKISGGIFAPITIIVFVYALIKNKDRKETILKILTFGLISLPLGLWYNVRNYIKFDQPFGYVYPQTIEMGNYTGNHSLFERFGVNFTEWTSSIGIDMVANVNFPGYFYKTSLFSCLSFTTLPESMLGLFLIVFGLIIMLIFVLSLFKMTKKNWNATLHLIVIVYYVISMLFYYKEPFTCSMEFRYMAFIVVPISLCIAQYYDRINNKILTDLTEISLIMFSCFSCAIYLVECFA